MATTLGPNSIAGDILIFDNIIKKAYKNANNELIKHMRKMIKDGAIQIDALFERAISMSGKHKRDSTMGRYFEDGSDAKKAVSHWVIEPDRNSVRRRATITNLKNKKGFLRVVVAETLTGKVYYFKVPNYAYRGLRGFNVYFNEDGTPKHDGKSWQYQCKSFKEMAL